MNKRNTSLDGLRGFAALSVFLAHAGLNIAALTNISFILIAYSTLSVGTNAVQILFVLSGFLMAYLYSDETNAFHFIRKRYTRIFPVYIVIILYLWLVSIRIADIWYEQLILLFIIALIFHIIWRAIRKFDIHGKVRTGIFYGFIILQVLLIAGLFVTASHFNQSYPQLLTALSNLLLATDVASGITHLSNQAWSLVPELLFYISFPFLAIPLIKLAQKRGILISILLVLGITKIFSDLDTAFYSFANLQSMNIARASGFIAGAVIGTIYKSQGRLWNFLEKIFNKSLSGIIALLLFLYVQWSVGAAIATGSSSISELNIYYLFSSWIIAFLIVAVILPNTMVNKIFGWKGISFFGVISYSVYLIHTSMLQISDSFILFITRLPATSATFFVLDLLFALTLTIVVSYLLFRYIESLYFLDKKHINNKALTKAVVEKPQKQRVSRIRIILSGIIFACLILVLYSGDYPISLTVERNLIIHPQNIFEVSIDKRPFFIPFNASNQNLSEVVVLLRYVNTSNHAVDMIKDHRQLVFRIYNQNKSKLIFESVRDASEVDGQLRFPFGFTPQTNSTSKKYIVELLLKGSENGENVLVNTSPTSFVSVYINPPIKRIKLLPSVIYNRFLFATSNPDAQFALTFLGFVILLELLPEDFKLSFQLEEKKLKSKNKK